MTTPEAPFNNPSPESENQWQEEVLMSELQEQQMCRVPIIRDGREFAVVMDEAGEFADQLIQKSGLEAWSNGSWVEELGHHIVIKTKQRWEHEFGQHSSLIAGCVLCCGSK